MRIRRALVAAATIAVTAALVGPGAAAPAVPTAAPSATGFSVQLGPEQRVYGPSTHVDMPFHTILGSKGPRRAFIANGDTQEVVPNADGTLGTGRIVLKRGPMGSFDQCGAWLMGSIHKFSETHWVGFYHAEAANHPKNWCIYSGGYTKWSMAIAESFDAGKTWQKRTYKIGTQTVNNQVITQHPDLVNNPDTAERPITEDAGNGRVVIHDGFFYMLYQAATKRDGERKLNVARAPLSSFGRPGSWKKYNSCFLCGWNQPGLGGTSTHLAGIPSTARSVVWSNYLQRWIAVSASGRYGFSMWQSDHPQLLKWTHRRFIYPPVNTTSDPTVDKWHNRGASDKGVYGYSSLLNLDLDATKLTGQDFYLYYMKVYPGQGFDKRYLVRRKMSVVPSSTLPVDRVQLTTYIVNVDGKARRRTSTEMPSPTLGYRAEGNAGYLLGAPRNGYLGIFECKTTSGDHYLKQTGCPTGTLVRRVGYASAQRSAMAPYAVWRCYDTVSARHFAASSTSATTKPAKCTTLGMKAEFVLGWSLPAIR